MSNSNPESRKERRRPARGLLALGATLMATGALLGLSAFAFAAPAETAGTAKEAARTIEIKGGYLDWRFTETIHDDEGDVRPSITVSGGATEKRDGTIRFRAVNGSYRAETGAATAEYRGTVVLTYPSSKITLADPVVVMNGTAAALRANVDVKSTGAAGTTGQTARPVQTATAGMKADQAEIGELKTFGIAPQPSGRTVTWDEIPTTLTATGARAFPETYFEGSDLGPVTVALTFAESPVAPGLPRARAAVTSPSPTLTPTATPTPTLTDCPTPTPTDSVTPTTTATSTVTPTPTPSDCVSPSPTDTAGTSTPSPSSTGNEQLPTTGAALIPLMLLGGSLTVAGGGTMLAARRRAMI